MILILLAAARVDCPADLGAQLASARAAGTVEALRETCRCGSPDACFELIIHPERQESDSPLAAQILGGICGQGGKPDCGTLASSDTLSAVERDCLAGQAARCGEASVRWREGQGVPVDLSKAHAFARMACVGGYWYSCNDLTALYNDPLGEQVSLTRFLAGCEQGQMVDCYWAGGFLRVGLGGLPEDEERGLALLVRSCEGGYGAACYDLGWPLLYEDPPDIDGWLSAMERACRGGSPDGCAELATPLRKLKAACRHNPAYCVLAERRKEGRWPAP